MRGATMKKLCFLSFFGVLALIIHAQAFGAGFFEQGTAPPGGYPSSPNFVHPGAQAFTVTDNITGSGGATDLKNFRDGFFSRNITGSGSGTISGYAAGGLTIYGGAALDNLFDGSYTMTPKLGDLMIKGLWMDARAEGATFDGTTDDTTTLQAAIAAMPSNKGVFVFPPGKTAIVTGQLSFAGKTNFMVIGNNATVKYKNATAVSSGKNILYFQNNSDGIIRDLILDANRANRSPAEVTAHNVYIQDNTSRLTFRNVRSINAVCDAWNLASSSTTPATYPTDILIIDCEGDNAYRQGLSAISTVRLHVKGGRYWGTNGTLPQSGIDLEPDAGYTGGNRDPLIEGVELFDNAGYGIQLGGAASTPNKNVRILNVRGSNNDNGMINAGNVSGLLVDGLLATDFDASNRGIVDLGTGIDNVTLRNLDFRNITAAGKECIYIHSGVSRIVKISNVHAVAIAHRIITATATAHISNVTGETIGEHAILIAGATAARSTVRDAMIQAVTGYGVYTDSADSVIENVQVINGSSTTASILADTNAGGSIFRNISINQTVSIPGGAVGMYFNSVPGVLENIRMKSAGTNYNRTTAFNFSAGIATTLIGSITPDPLTNTAVWDPGAAGDGQTVATNITVTGAAPGDMVSVSSDNTVRIMANNGTGGTIDLPSSTWKVTVRKRF